MQRTDTLIKVISTIVLIAIVFYIGYYLYDSQANPLTTAAAMEYTIKESAHTTGYAVRTEKQLSGGASRVSVTADDGEKLAANSTYALKFSSVSSMEAAQKANELELKVLWLEALVADGNTAADAMAKDSVRALAYSIDSGSFSNLDELLADINVKLFHSSDFTEENLQAELESTRAQLEAMEDELETDMERLTVSESGIFSRFVDGFEAVDAERLVGLSPDELTQLFSSPANTDGASGKLVTDIYWRYAAIVNESDAAKLKVGDRVELEFSLTFNGTVAMEVESIGEVSGGQCVVVFVSSSNLNDVIAVRELNSDIIFSVTTGIRIPKEAVQQDGETEQYYVYVISGVQAQRVDINILTEYDEYYLAESGGNLRDGMEIIVEARDLYIGKVVR